eukprot:RCo015507
MAKEKAPEKEKPGKGKGKGKEDDKKAKKVRKFPPRPRVWKDHTDKSTKRNGPTAQQAAKKVERARKVKPWDQAYRLHPRRPGRYRNPFMAYPELKQLWQSVQLPSRGRIDIDALWSARSHLTLPVKLQKPYPTKGVVKNILVPFPPLGSHPAAAANKKKHNNKKKPAAKPAESKPAAAKPAAPAPSKEKVAKQKPAKGAAAKKEVEREAAKKSTKKGPQGRSIIPSFKWLRNLRWARKHPNVLRMKILRKAQAANRRVGKQVRIRPQHRPLKCVLAARKAWKVYDYFLKFGPFARKHTLKEYFKGIPEIPKTGKLVRVNYKKKINFYRRVYKVRSALTNRVQENLSKAPQYIKRQQNLTLEQLQADKRYRKFIYGIMKKPAAQVSRSLQAYIVLLVRDNGAILPNLKERTEALAKASA